MAQEPEMPLLMWAGAGGESEAVCGPVWHFIHSIYKLPERLLLVLDTERAVSVNWAERESA